jgi:hypothetical protein
VNQAAIEAKDPSRNAVGIGPFEFVEWVQGDHLTLKKNDSYFESGKPYLDGLTIRYLADTTMVMFAGELVEGGDALAVMDAPAHPYTRLLLSAVPDPERAGSYDPVERARLREAILNPTACPYDDGTCSRTEPVRHIVGEDILIGRSTHTAEQADAAAVEHGVDYFAVGPVWATPTKPGRPAAGPSLIAHVAAQQVNRPWFAIGGIDADNLGEVLALGASRVVVVRALTEAADPRKAAETLISILEMT